jgi:hypothetical protein
MAEGNGDEITLRDWIKRNQEALDQAKQRTGRLPETFGRFRTAEEELARLKQSPDQEDTRRDAVYLLQSLNRVQPEALPIWPAFPVATAGLVLVSGVPYSGRIAFLLVGGTAIGFAAQQYLKSGPSISDGKKLLGDPEESKKQADMDIQRTMKEQDEKDTKQIEEEARKDLRKRHYEGSQEQQKAERYFPSFFPVPGNPSQRRFGYYKDGQFVVVPFDTPTTFQGKAGQWHSDGRFYPTQ